MEITPYDLKEIAASGYGTINIKPVGYWSGTVALYIRRKRDWTPEGTTIHWEISLSHSSGGRDTNEEPDDLIAEEHFANAILHAAALGRELRDHDFETEYQAAKARDAAARQAEIDALVDITITPTQATDFADALERGQEIPQLYKPRSLEKGWVTVRWTRRGHPRYDFEGAHGLSKKQAIERIYSTYVLR